MNQYVIYNSIYHILICRQCSCAIPQDWILPHFRWYHKTIALETRQEIINYGTTLDLWDPIKVQEHMEIMNNKSQIEGLTAYVGFQCQVEGCMKFTRTKESMKKHYRGSHGWGSKDGVKWRKQSIQSFFVGQHIKYVLFLMFLILDILR